MQFQHRTFVAKTTLDTPLNFRYRFVMSFTKPFQTAFHAFLLAIVAFYLPCSAQVVTATLTGTVTDSSTAAVPDAKVTVTAAATGVSRTVSTNGDGIFS